MTALPILDLIGKYEAAGGNYNIVHGGAILPLTNMTVQDVLNWQKTSIDASSKYVAAGKYQIIHETMKGLVETLDIETDELFDEDMQDYMALALLERRGFYDYLDGKTDLNTMVFNLSKEWAAFPKDETGVSFYAGDGVNKALVSYKEVVESLIFEKSERLKTMEKENVIKSGVKTSEFWLNIITYVLTLLVTVLNEVFAWGLDASEIAMTTLPTAFYTLNRMGVKIYGGGALDQKQAEAIVKSALVKQGLKTE